MRTFLFSNVLIALALAGCDRASPGGYQGYLEGDFVYIASPLGGQLETLNVQKGARVTAGTPLFSLERSAELSSQREAADRLRATQARLEDLKKGARPSELAALEARLEQARAAAELSKRELERQEALFKSGAISVHELDRARLTHQGNDRAVDNLIAQLATAQLGARTDAVLAVEADVAAAAAAKERADWAVTQKTRSAPRDALVYDTLYREGEFIAAGSPVVALLPPENLKVRFFVSESEFGSLKAGDRVRVALTGAAPLDARINYLSPKPEYTPPVLYNRDNRAKLVFMIEATFDGAVTAYLHPGQPADVTRISP